MGKYDAVIIDLPEGFPIKTNGGLHGNMQFFEMSEEHEMTVCEPYFEKDTYVFHYTCYDSDEGSVTITYRTICGSDADADEVLGWDVEITTGSDGWSLAESASAVRDAVVLHEALGLFRHKQNPDFFLRLQNL